MNKKVFMNGTAEKKFQVTKGLPAGNADEGDPVIPTVNDMSLSVGTVTPHFGGENRYALDNLLCLWVGGETYSEETGYNPVYFCEPVALNREGARQLIYELQKYVNCPF